MHYIFENLSRKVKYFQNVGLKINNIILTIFGAKIQMIKSDIFAIFNAVF